MDTAKQSRQQSVTRHGEPHPCLPELKYQQRRNHPHHRADSLAHTVFDQLFECRDKVWRKRSKQAFARSQARSLVAIRSTSGMTIVSMTIGTTG